MDFAPVFVDVMEGDDIHVRFLRVAGSGRTESAQRLLRDGAMPGSVDFLGDNALMRAALYNTKKMADVLADLGFPLLFANKSGRTLLHVLARNGWTDLAEKALDAGADVNARDELGNTPLIEAASRGKVEAARLLMSRGADPNAVNAEGNTAAYYLHPVVRQILRGEDPLAETSGTAAQADVEETLDAEPDYDAASSVRTIRLGR